jgi:hypothetical protein
MLYSMPEQEVSSCPHYSQGQCKFASVLVSEKDRKSFEGDKPAFCTGFFSDGLLKTYDLNQDYTNRLIAIGTAVRVDLKYSRGSGKATHPMGGNSLQEEGRVVRVYQHNRTMTLWVEISEDWDWSYPKLFSRWLCTPQEISVFKISRDGIATIGTTSVEGVRFGLGTANRVELANGVRTVIGVEQKQDEIDEMTKALKAEWH